MAVVNRLVVTTRLLAYKTIHVLFIVEARLLINVDIEVYEISNIPRGMINTLSNT